jgi:uncharacterized protein (TIGR03437 family)
VEVSIDGRPAGLHSVNDQRIELVAPLTMAAGAITMTATSATGTFFLAQVSLIPASPGIFFDIPTNLGAVRRVNNALEIYGTGFGTGLAVTVRLGGLDLTPFWYGPNSVYPGLDQVNVDIPEGLTGERTLSIEVNGVRSNEVRVFL